MEPDTKMEASMYLCGWQYDRIVEQLYDGYYRHALSLGEVWSTDLYVEIELEVANAETYRDRLLDLQDRVTNKYYKPINISIEISGADTMTFGFNAMGVLPYLDLTEESLLQFYMAMDRAETWCNEDMYANAEVDMAMYMGASIEELYEGVDPGLEILGDGMAFMIGNYLPGGMLEAFAKSYVEEWIKDEEDYKALDIETLQKNVPYSVLYA